MDTEITTTFWMDFSIADRFGVAAVKDTFKRAFKEWRTNTAYLTDLVITLNHKIWQHYENGNETLANVYNDLWMKADAWACEHLTGDDMSYYYRMTD